MAMSGAEDAVFALNNKGVVTGRGCTVLLKPMNALKQPEQSATARNGFVVSMRIVRRRWSLFLNDRRRIDPAGFRPLRSAEQRALASAVFEGTSLVNNMGLFLSAARCVLCVSDHTLTVVR
jgi:hypothetical protein